jgi:hypothetical protein
MLHASRFARSCFGLAFALLMLASASQVMAAAYVRAQAYAYDQNLGDPHDTGQIAGPLALAESGPLADFGGSFHSKARATYGALGNYSTSDNTYPLYQSFGVAESWWVDTFTVTGTPGTQVTYNLGFHLDDALSATEYPNAPSNLGAQAVAHLDGIGAAAGLSIHDEVTNLGSNLAANRTVWKAATFTVGDIVTVGCDFYTHATAQDGTATANAYSTALFALQVVTPGGGYMTENGVVFAPSFVPGDVDGDGHVDVVDLLYFVDAFGSVTGDSNYDPRCDFNSDGSVDVVDLLILVENFGT